MIKSFPVRKYDAVNKTWILPANPYTKTLIKQHLSPIADILVLKQENEKSTISKEFIDHLERKRYSKNTIKNYLHHLKLYLEFQKNKKLLHEDTIVAYFNYLIYEKKATSSYQHMAVNSIKLYIENILNLKMPHLSMRPKHEKKLPLILSEKEIESIISVIKNKKHKMIVSLIYSAGLRVRKAGNILPKVFKIYSITLVTELILLNMRLYIL